jgi:Spy/CpxP family protein refolding chaperone
MRSHLRTDRLRRLLVTSAALLLGLALVPSVHAQQGAGGGRMDPQARMQQRIEMLTTRLQLTPQQVEQLKPILQKQSDDMRALFEKANGDFASVRPEMQQLREKTDAQVEAILTDAQKKQYAEIQKEMQARRNGGGGGQR